MTIKASLLGTSLVLSLLSSAANADATGTGKITVIGGQFTAGAYPAAIYFGISPVPVNRATCSTDTRYQFVFDPTTAEGKALYAALLAAQAADIEITVRGTGGCILGQSLEGVLYWRQSP